MRLFWKQFIGILMILVVMFTLFGSVLIQTSFQTALDREVEAALEEATLFHYTLLSSAESMSNTYSLDQKVIIELLKTIDENAGNTADVLVLYDANRAVLYRRGKETNNLPIQMRNFDELVWQLAEREEIHYLDTMVRLKLGKSEYYIEKNRNVQQVYESRDLLLTQYRAVVGILMGVACIFAALLAYGFTVPVRRLSQATKTFATGDYTSRVKPMGKDELTVLMKDFNSMAEQLETNIWELNDAVRRQEEFTGAFAHELKTPLAAIRLLTDSILQNDMDMETVREFVGDIGNEADRLTRTTGKLLSLTKVDGQVSEDCEIIKMAPTVERVIRMLSGIAQQNSITIEADLSEDSPVLILEDDLYQIAFNLIENGIKYNISGGKLTVHLLREEDNAILRVSDTGMGIPEDALSHIFERFYRVDKARSRATGGSGLGLAIVRAIVQRNRGEITVDTEVGKGTVFTVTFPVFETEVDAL